MTRRLTPGELLPLQLRAIGYSVAQLTDITGRPAEAVTAAIASAAQALGARDEREALEVARRRGLIV